MITLFKFSMVICVCYQLLLDYLKHLSENEEKSLNSLREKKKNHNLGKNKM